MFPLQFHRCGALSVGDQILSVDETVIENTSFTPDEVTSFLDCNCTKGYTQIQILPAHALLRRRGEYFSIIIRFPCHYEKKHKDIHKN